MSNVDPARGSGFGKYFCMGKCCSETYRETCFQNTCYTVWTYAWSGYILSESMVLCTSTLITGSFLRNVQT